MRKRSMQERMRKLEELMAVSDDRALLSEYDELLSRFETLGVADFELLAALDAEIVLLGTGNQLRFPRPELLQPLIKAQKGLEVMDIQAACRTYNVLIGEGRRVAAALIFA